MCIYTIQNLITRSFTYLSQLSEAVLRDTSNIDDETE
jgi:hypothetical protein